MSNTIAIGSLIEWVADDATKIDERKIDRVLWLDNIENTVVLYEIDNNKALPRWCDLDIVKQALDEGTAIKLTSDPYFSRTSPNSTYLTRHQERRDWAWQLIADLVENEPAIYFEQGRGTLVHMAAEQHHVHPMTIYKYMRKYWAGGKTKNALLPGFDKCGAPGKERITPNEKIKRGRPSRLTKVSEEPTGINIDEDIINIFKTGLRLFYDTNDKAPMTRAYNLTIGRFFNVGYREEDGLQVPVLPSASELPTLGQFKYHARKILNPQKSTENREGKAAFNLKHRAVLGDSTQMAKGPGSIFQIDATVADIYLVSSFDRTCVIGRPIIYVVIDVFSRMITGIYVGLEGPSWLGAMMALANATTDKVSYCAKHEIYINDSDWPCHYLPERFLADNGEMIGYNSDNLTGALDIKVDNAASYRADWKGIVEQAFRIANLRVIHWLPGAVKARYRERGEEDHRLDATMTLSEFTKVIIYMVLDHNKNHRLERYMRDENMIQDHLEPIPIKLWNWGIAHRSGHLREKAPEIIMLNLMPRGEAKVTFRGIEFKGMRYSCERAIAEQWFIKARKKQWKVPIAYDLRDTNQIYLLLNKEKEIEVCDLLESQARYKDRCLEEVLDLIELEKVASAGYETDKLQSTARLNAQVDSVVAEAEQRPMQRAKGSRKVIRR